MSCGRPHYLGTIGTNTMWPAWADAGGLPDLTKWQNFVGQLVAHYGTEVPYWEIWNEPQADFTPDFYAQMLPIPVELDCSVATLPVRDQQAGLDGGTNA